MKVSTRLTFHASSTKVYPMNAHFSKLGHPQLKPYRQCHFETKLTRVSLHVCDRLKLFPHYSIFCLNFNSERIEFCVWFENNHCWCTHGFCEWSAADVRWHHVFNTFTTSGLVLIFFFLLQSCPNSPSQIWWGRSPVPHPWCRHPIQRHHSGSHGVRYARFCLACCICDCIQCFLPFSPDFSNECCSNSAFYCNIVYCP